MPWILASLVVVILAAAAIIATGRWGSMPPVIDDRPPSRVPTGRLSGDDLLREVRFRIVPRGYDPAQVDLLLDRAAAELRLREAGATSGEVSGETIREARFDVVARGYVPTDIDALLVRLAEQLDPPALHAAQSESLPVHEASGGVLTAAPPAAPRRGAPGDLE